MPVVHRKLLAGISLPKRLTSVKNVSDSNSDFNSRKYKTGWYDGPRQWLRQWNNFELQRAITGISDHYLAAYSLRLPVIVFEVICLGRHSDNEVPSKEKKRRRTEVLGNYRTHQIEKKGMPWPRR